MPTSILATGTDAAESNDIVVAAGDVVHLHLREFDDGRAKAFIQLKDSAGKWSTIGSMSPESTKIAQVIAAPGTYRVQRPAGQKFGVDRD